MFTRLRMKSNIIFKPSFLKYLGYCTEKGLIYRHRSLGRKMVTYCITEKGRIFLRMLEEKD